MGSAVNIHVNRQVSTQKGNNKGRPRAKRLRCSKPLQTNVQCRLAARQTDESGLSVGFSFLFFRLCPKSEVDSLRQPILSCHQHLSEDFFAVEELSFNETRREKNSHLHWMRVICMVH